MALPARMEQAKHILPRLFQQRQALFPDKLELVRGYWPETVGPLLAHRSNPVRLVAGRLVVEAQGLPWLELLAPMREQIVDALRSELPDTHVTTIEFRLAVDPDAGTERLKR